MATMMIRTFANLIYGAHSDDDDDENKGKCKNNQGLVSQGRGRNFLTRQS